MTAICCSAGAEWTHVRGAQSDAEIVGYSEHCRCGRCQNLDQRDDGHGMDSGSETSRMRTETIERPKTPPACSVT